MQDANFSCTETTSRRYKLDGEVSRRVFDRVSARTVNGEVPRRAFDEVNTRAVRGEVPRRDFEEVHTEAVTGEVPRHAFEETKTRAVRGEVPRRAFDEVRTIAISGEVPRRAFDEVNTRAVRGELSRRAFEDVNTRAVSGEVPRRVLIEANTKAVSTKTTVVPPTVTVEAGIGGRIRERETWTKIAHGGHGGGSNEPLRMQGNQYDEPVEAGCRSSESSRPRPRPVATYEARHDMSPRTCECDASMDLLHGMSSAFYMRPVCSACRMHTSSQSLTHD